ncbi:MAG: hypothetical protein AAFR61_29775 [Bacteroidota bacterium]
MKMPNAYSISLRFMALALLASVMTSCVPVEGPRGPQGPAGQDGNANIWSITYSALESDWYDVGTPGTEGYFLALDLDVPEIDQLVVNNGLVLVYYRPDTQSPWFALPYTVINHNPEYIEKLDMTYDLGFVGLQSKATDLNATPFAGDFRVIVADAFPVGKTTLDFSNYEVITDLLGLEESNNIDRPIQKHGGEEMD